MSVLTEAEYQPAPNDNRRSSHPSIAIVPSKGNLMWENSNMPPKKENSKCGGLYNGFLTDFWCAGVASRGPPKHGAWCAPAACTTDPPANCGVTTGPTTNPPGSWRSPRSPLPPHQHQQPTPMPSREDSMSGVRCYVCAAAAAGIAPQTRAVGLTRSTERCVVSHAKWCGGGVACVLCCGVRGVRQ